MTKMLEPTLDEIREEAVITKRILDRVPSDKLAWKPHQKSMSLGQLALHVATIPGALTKLLQQDGFDVSQANFNPPIPKQSKRSMPPTTKAFGQPRTLSAA